MTFKFYERFFAAVAGLILLFLGVCVLILGLGIFPFSLDSTVQSFLLGDFVPWQRIVVVSTGLIACALGMHGISLLFRRYRDQGFIMQHTEHGNVSISMHAMETMVKKCVDTHEELKTAHTKIHRSREGVVVDMRIILANGSNIPLTVNALQKQIKHYITSCSGVDVKEVRVMVEMGSHSSKNAEMITPEMAAAEASGNITSFTEAGQQASPDREAIGEKEPIHQRLFKHEGMPSVLPKPPVEILDRTSVFEESAGIETAVAEAGEIETEEQAQAEDPPDAHNLDQEDVWDSGEKENG
ncbi:MAG: alkaline shock response membrane anchor protein AmaP [Clostridia bacterium]|nr:alkaline shock response membrane anchor protein AmaP [Clostridia bacterium]